MREYTKRFITTHFSTFYARLLPILKLSQHLTGGVFSGWATVLVISFDVTIRNLGAIDTVWCFPSHYLGKFHTRGIASQDSRRFPLMPRSWPNFCVLVVQLWVFFTPKIASRTTHCNNSTIINRLLVRILDIRILMKLGLRSTPSKLFGEPKNHWVGQACILEKDAKSHNGKSEFPWCDVNPESTRYCWVRCEEGMQRGLQ